MGTYKDLLQEAMAEAEARGKEPFDFKKFAGMYLHDTGNCEKFTGNEPATTQEYYRNMYYTQFPGTMTVKDFARELDEIEAQS